MDTPLRPARPDDAAAILALMLSVIPAVIDPPHQADTVGNVSANLEAWTRHPDHGVHLVATLNDQVVGVVLIKEFWNLCSLFVRQDLQRRGIGRRLVLAAVSSCQGRSPVDAVYLNAAPGAIAFYQRLGFQPRPSRQVLPPGFLPMSLPLPAREA